ncbi:MAG: hypothetical protein O8C64_08695 [Candidatus Methanoperedens sp.]|nr:hypothetical protein [Candidatus Methanoperedens sp.]MCZ7406100.1 hypothetical protein [Candidatus Methanoperedens sp.]
MNEFNGGDIMGLIELVTEIIGALFIIYVFVVYVFPALPHT